MRRYLTQHVPGLADATSYLAAYDGVTGLRWSELGSALDAMPQEPTVMQEILRAANTGFRAMCSWFRDDESLQQVGT